MHFISGEIVLCFTILLLVSLPSSIYAESSKIDAITELESLVRSYHDLKRQAHEKTEKKRVVSDHPKVEEASGNKRLDVKSANKYLDELLRRYTSLVRAQQAKKPSSTITVKPINPLSKTVSPPRKPFNRFNKIDTSSNSVFDLPGRDCGLKARLTYRKCLITANSENDYCARQFVGDYPSCFFHNMTSGVDAFGCMRTCIAQFDQCMYFSTKPEVMVCMQARGECTHQCPAVNGQVVKRGCYEDCAGYFQVCEQLVTQTEDLYICKENERQCKERCAQEAGACVPLLLIFSLCQPLKTMKLTHETVKRLESLIDEYKSALEATKKSDQMKENQLEENHQRDESKSDDKNDDDLLTILRQDDAVKGSKTQSKKSVTKMAKDDSVDTRQVQNSDSATYHSEPAPTKDQMQVCTRKCHHDYYKCTYLKGTDVECARILAKCYPSCFQRPKVLTNFQSCSGSCMKSFDQCFFISKNRPEQLMCLTARNQCINECPDGQRKQKRGCNEDCAGNYDVCEQMVNEIYEIVQCIGNRDVCLGYC